ncbi:MULTISPECIES: hypothetical protein [Microbacterium]|uniref:hypothetical protein n=1 Tax=Microbacterium TaxID=33882 RepID=UPI00146EB7BB|nr:MULTISPECIES: hypothetical protein [Microbacterium]
MTNAEVPVVKAVREARAHQKPEDVIDGVKRAVADEMRRLDPSVKIEKTDYFNHSYVPDMVATWREDGKKRERRIFIRGSLRAVVAAEDIDALADQEPLILGLEDEKKRTWSRLRDQMPKQSRTLATEITATAQIVAPAGSPTDATQLSGLVRANIVRGGRGVLDDGDAQRIVGVEQQEPLEALKAFNKTVRRLFVGATAERLTRTATLLQVFFENEPDATVLAQLEEDSLTDSELRVVLPYVLQRAGDVRVPQVWRTLATMLTMERLESMSGALDGLDLTPLVRQAAPALMAGRSSLFFNPAEMTEEEMDATPPHWHMRSGRLAADVRRWTMWFGSDARKLRGREDGPDARWDELSPPLRGFDLTGIELRGLSRQLSVATTKGDTVREDVEQIRTTIEDDFHVSSVSVRASGDETAPTVKVEFAAATATGKAPVAFHVRALTLLSVKRPIANDDIAALLDSSDNGSGSGRT